MARARHQDGWVEPVGKRVKIWRGHYYVYDADGTRHHKTVDLGLRKNKPKWEAEQALRKVIEEKTGLVQQARGSDTLEWFWKERFAPMQTWDADFRGVLDSVFKRHVFPVIGSVPLEKLDRFQLQMLIQNTARDWSKSVVHKIRTYLKACLEEAVDQDVIAKNPMRKLPMPELRQECRRYLLMDEIRSLLDKMEPRDRLIARICIVCGLRPGELFGARWDDFDPGAMRLRIDEAAVEGQMKATKTTGSCAFVWLAPPIVESLKAWRETQSGTFIFPNRDGGPIRTQNFLKRHVWPAAVKAGIMQARPKELPKGARWTQKETSVNFQAFRRTCATWFQQHGTAKDIQAHLRHSKLTTTFGVYVQEIPESVRTAVEALDSHLFATPETSNLKIN